MTVTGSAPTRMTPCDLHRAASDERTELNQNAALVFGEKLPRPADGVGQGLMSCWGAGTTER
ncbi:MAG: hypothetical protein ACJATT_004677 [Myxococcota bacterium]|jgi:hypothetical protein